MISPFDFYLIVIWGVEGTDWERVFGAHQNMKMWFSQYSVIPQEESCSYMKTVVQLFVPLRLCHRDRKSVV